MGRPQVGFTHGRGLGSPIPPSIRIYWRHRISPNPDNAQFSVTPVPDLERGAETPALLQVVVQLPSRCGSSKAGTYDSWGRCLISAFISTAAFDPHSRYYEWGGPVSGFTDGANSKEPFVPHLTGWEKVRASGWKLLSASSSPTAIELNSDVISMLPQLSKKNFATTHAPNLTYGRLVAPEVPKYYFDERPAASSANPPACTRPQDPNARPANSDERRLHARWLERRTFGRGIPNRRGRPSAKVIMLVTSPPFLLQLGTNPRGDISL